MLTSLIARELKSRYKGSLLGFLWSIVTPLFMAVIYVFFLRILARGVPIEDVIIGVFAWQFTAQSVNSGMECITSNANLVKKVAFPRIILPTASALANLVNYLFSLVVQFALLAVILHAHGSHIRPLAIFLPVIVIHQTLFNLAIAMLLGASNTYFRDTQHLIGVLLSAWFFMSPMMYTLSFIEQLAGGHTLLLNLYMLNPLAVIVTGYRALILPGTAFPWTVSAVVGWLIPLLLFAIALPVFRRAQKNFADML